MREKERFMAAVREGLADVEAGRLLDDEEVERLLDEEFGSLKDTQEGWKQGSRPFPM